MNLATTSLKQLAQALQQRRISSRELAQAYLERIARLNPGLGAFITTDHERTFAQADAADARIAAGTAGPLTKSVVHRALGRSCPRLRGRKCTREPLR